MKALRFPFPYARMLAFLRTRLLGAVVMPALLGAAWAARKGTLPGLRLGLVLVGLAAAELLNLFGADYAHWRGGALAPSRGTGTVILPGNPVVAPAKLPPGRITAVLLPLAVVGLGVLVYFTIAVGAGVLLLFAAAAAIGGLYVFSPFPYAFLSTAVIPPLISGGTLLALSGAAQAPAFWTGLPIAWVSVAVILGYRVLYEPQGGRALSVAATGSGAGQRWRRRKTLVVGSYVLAGATVISWVPLGFLPPAGLFALIPWAGCLTWIVVILHRRAADTDPVPATAVGVLMHSLSCAALALAVWLG